MDGWKNKSHETSFKMTLDPNFSLYIAWPRMKAMWTITGLSSNLLRLLRAIKVLCFLKQQDTSYPSRISDISSWIIFLCKDSILSSTSFLCLRNFSPGNRGRSDSKWVTHEEYIGTALPDQEDDIGVSGKALNNSKSSLQEQKTSIYFFVHCIDNSDIASNKHSIFSLSLQFVTM